jgi:hypothetical protein
VRFLGVVSASAALVLGVAGSAMACSIRDFSAMAECDANGKGVISVTDVDPTGITAEITVYLENNGAGERLVGTKTIENPTAKGVTVTFSEEWKPNAEYRIHVKAGSYVDEDIQPNLTTPSEACETEDTPPAMETPKPSDKPSSPTDTPTPAASENTMPATTGDDNAPSPEGDANLAETGANSTTPVIGGIAAALVAIGGGAVYYGTRRRGTSSH